MGPAVVPLIGAGLGLLGSILANRSSAKEAQRNRMFQERMSSTAHQREVMDLSAAGLNPILSASRGASTPSGAVADVRDVGEGAVRGIASALSVKQAQANIELTRAQAAAANAAGQESNARTGIITNEAQAGRYELIRQQVLRGKMDLEQQQK